MSAGVATNVGAVSASLLAAGSWGCDDSALDPVTAANQCLIIPDRAGLVREDANECGVGGLWFAYNDCNDSPGDCTKNQWPEEGSFPNSNGRMCTRGTTAAVADETESPFKWGAAIALSLNQPTTVGPQHPIGDLGIEIRGFSFMLSGFGPAVRVNFPTRATETAPHFVTVTGEGQHVVPFAAARQGEWVDEGDRAPLDWTQVIAIQFHVPAEQRRPIDFSFCIEDLAVLYVDGS